MCGWNRWGEEKGGTQAAYSRGQKPQCTSKASFPGSGQAGVPMTPHQQQHYLVSPFQVLFLLSPLLPFLSFHICLFIGYRFVTDQQIYCRFKRLQGPSLAPPVLCLSIIRFYKSHKEDLNGSCLRPLSLSTLMPPLPKLPSHMVTIKETCHLGNPAKRKSS